MPKKTCQIIQVTAQGQNKNEKSFLLPRTQVLFIFRLYHYSIYMRVKIQRHTRHLKLIKNLLNNVFLLMLFKNKWSKLLFRVVSKPFSLNGGQVENTT